MLRAVRERNGRSLADTGLPFLFDSTYRATFLRLEDFANARTVGIIHPVTRDGFAGKLLDVWRGYCRSKGEPATNFGAA